MRRKYFNREKQNGELAVRSLSKKAQTFYNDTEGEVYEYESDDKVVYDVCLWHTEWHRGLSLDELDELFSVYYDELEMESEGA